MTPLEYVTALLRRLPGIVHDEMRKQPEVLAVYISDNMNVGAHPNWNAAKKRYNRPYKKNATNKLYTNTNQLLAAATVKGKKGYRTTVKASASMVQLEVAIDLNDIPYARIHELGGKAGRGRKVRIRARPYIAPALKSYEREELRQLVNNIYVKLGAIA